MITDKYLQCLKELQNNPNIEIGKYSSDTNYYDCEPPSERFLERRKKELEEENIIISDKDMEYFNLSSIIVNWDDILKEPTDIKVLRGGFVINDITDPLIYPTDYFKNTINIKNDGDYSQQLGWFERLPMGVDDSMRGCFIKEEGNFPPPIVFCNAGGGWYVKIDFDYYKYMELLFENYGFKGWQYFYIDIVKEIPRLDQVLDDMRVAVKTLPLLFPDKDWSYHQKRYQDVLEKLERTE
ncbi:hypothetical protein [Chryseobacterium luteum]|uniref:Uncharacterized protein n=1 Tax=Chryseobacterium luteum TaxID=421531 RepID=A0A085ZAI2_9FLAO|nr:hypothetical protein [Chryseobacterium luteum]KFF01446.1 hypothetical protein IX38_17810 [Chryseobacterium luteum]